MGRTRSQHHSHLGRVHFAGRISDKFERLFAPLTSQKCRTHRMTQTNLIPNDCVYVSASAFGGEKSLPYRRCHGVA